ncbi:MAG: hypothetical protein O3A14_17410 [Cyanobacteria bacterium]|nr:hypothetical protein [Cyanobacteriota bacterium]
MTALKRLEAAVRYFSEAVMRIFSPNEKEIPQVGVQPFGGEPPSEWVDEG